MRTAAFAAMLALALPALAAADPPPSGIVHPAVPPGTPLKELGYQLYAGNCSSCHGARGEGIAPPRPGRAAGAVEGAGPPLRGVGALAADFYLRTGYMPLNHPDEQPRRSRVLFSNRELDALIAYVASLGSGPPVPRPHPEQADVAAGLHAFTEHCAGCHQVVAEGGLVTGGVAPPLDDATSVQIAEAVRTGPYLMPRFSKRALGDDELDAIIAYVQYAKNPDDRGGWALGHLGPVPEGMVAWLLAGAVLVAVCVVLAGRLRE
jgi:ubiquinol-cytochrome c reductase cytochrome c subunit